MLFTVVLNLVLVGEIFEAKVARTLNRTIGDPFKYLPCLKEGLCFEPIVKT